MGDDQKDDSEEFKTFAMKRLRRDFEEWQRCSHETPNVTAIPLNYDIFEWHINMCADNDYLKNICFHLIITFPSKYPIIPPKVQLCNYLLHPNVLETYDNSDQKISYYICLDMLNDNWSPAYSVSSLLIQLQSFLFSESIPQGYGRNVSLSFESHDIKKMKEFSLKFSCFKCGHSHSKPYPPLFKSSETKSNQCTNNNNDNNHNNIKRKRKRNKKFFMKSWELLLCFDIELLILRYLTIIDLLYIMRVSKHFKVMVNKSKILQMQRFRCWYYRVSLTDDAIMNDNNNNNNSLILGYGFTPKFYDRYNIIYGNFKSYFIDLQQCSSHQSIKLMNRNKDKKNQNLSLFNLTRDQNLEFCVLRSCEIISFDLLSKDAFMIHNIKTTPFDRKNFTHFIPIYINKKHGIRSLNALKEFTLNVFQIKSIYYNPYDPNNNKDNNNNNNNYNKNNHNHSNVKNNNKLTYHPMMSVHLICNIMSCLVLKLMNSLYDKNRKLHHSINVFELYFDFYHLLLALYHKYYGVIFPFIQQKCNNFINNPDFRHKKYVPNLDEFMIWFTLCKNLSSNKVFEALLDESLIRRVKWIIHKFPNKSLSDYAMHGKINLIQNANNNHDNKDNDNDNDNDNDDEDNKKEDEKKEEKKEDDKNDKKTLYPKNHKKTTHKYGNWKPNEMQIIWNNSLTSLRVFMFQCFILNNFCEIGIKTPHQKFEEYNALSGCVPSYLINELQQFCKKVDKVSNWKEFFDAIQVIKYPNYKRMHQWLENCAKISKERGYHRCNDNNNNNNNDNKQENTVTKKTMEKTGNDNDEKTGNDNNNNNNNHNNNNINDDIEQSKESILKFKHYYHEKFFEFVNQNNIKGVKALLNIKDIDDDRKKDSNNNNNKNNKNANKKNKTKWITLNAKAENNLLTKCKNTTFDIDRNMTDCNGRSPLFCAAYYGYYNLIELLLNNGFNPKIIDIHGKNVMNAANDGKHKNFNNTETVSRIIQLLKQKTKLFDEETKNHKIFNKEKESTEKKHLSNDDEKTEVKPKKNRLSKKQRNSKSYKSKQEALKKRNEKIICASKLIKISGLPYDTKENNLKIMFEKCFGLESVLQVIYKQSFILLRIRDAIINKKISIMNHSFMFGGIIFVELVNDEQNPFIDNIKNNKLRAIKESPMNNALLIHNFDIIPSKMLNLNNRFKKLFDGCNLIKISTNKYGEPFAIVIFDDINNAVRSYQKSKEIPFKIGSNLLRIEYASGSTDIDYDHCEFHQES